MFFLLRMAFWLGLVLVLLPRDKTPESDKLPQIGASDAVSAASAADVRHGPVLQAPAGGLRGRRPGGDRDRPTRPGRRAARSTRSSPTRSPRPITSRLDRLANAPKTTARGRHGTATAADTLDAQDDLAAVEWRLPGRCGLNG